MAALRGRHNRLVDELLEWRQEYETCHPAGRGEIEAVIDATKAEIARLYAEYWKQREAVHNVR